MAPRLSGPPCHCPRRGRRRGCTARSWIRGVMFEGEKRDERENLSGVRSMAAVRLGTAWRSLGGKASTTTTGTGATRATTTQTTTTATGATRAVITPTTREAPAVMASRGVDSLRPRGWRPWASNTANVGGGEVKNISSDVIMLLVEAQCHLRPFSCAGFWASAWSPLMPSTEVATGRNSCRRPEEIVDVDQPERT